MLFKEHMLRNTSCTGTTCDEKNIYLHHRATSRENWTGKTPKISLNNPSSKYQLKNKLFMTLTSSVKSVWYRKGYFCPSMAWLPDWYNLSCHPKTLKIISFCNILDHTGNCYIEILTQQGYFESRTKSPVNRK